MARFGHRHRNLGQILDESYATIAPRLGSRLEIDEETRRLIGSFFTREYSIESAAIFNPSIVLAPEQPEQPDRIRFVMSLRTVGEGHISTIQFCSGEIDGTGEVELASRSPFAATGTRRRPTYAKATLRTRLNGLDADEHVVGAVFDELAETFSFEELMTALGRVEESSMPRARWFETVRLIHWLASSNYSVSFSDMELTERVLFPVGPAESKGMEDARFVRFDADGDVTYFATYTAYDGFEVLPQLIETRDFVSFRVATLSGACARNKGMAIFPRPIDGMITALARWDRQNLHVLRTDDPHRWDETELLAMPEEPWEMIKIGNCGSPIETEAGWLVLTHGVGPMRRYAMGAMLLDLDHPTKIIGRLEDPFAEPYDDERDGYVPNAIYSCGGLVHRGFLFVPYGFADYGTGMLRVPLANLLDTLVRTNRSG